MFFDQNEAVVLNINWGSCAPFSATMQTSLFDTIILTFLAHSAAMLFSMSDLAGPWCLFVAKGGGKAAAGAPNVQGLSTSKHLSYSKVMIDLT